MLTTLAPNHHQHASDETEMQELVHPEPAEAFILRTGAEPEIKLAKQAQVGVAACKAKHDKFKVEAKQMRDGTLLVNRISVPCMCGPDGGKVVQDDETALRTVASALPNPTTVKERVNKNGVLVHDFVFGDSGDVVLTLCPPSPGVVAKSKKPTDATYVLLRNTADAMKAYATAEPATVASV